MQYEPGRTRVALRLVQLLKNEKGLKRFTSVVEQPGATMAGIFYYNKDFLSIIILMLLLFTENIVLYNKFS